MSPCSFPTTITITPRAPPTRKCIIVRSLSIYLFWSLCENEYETLLLKCHFLNISYLVQLEMKLWIYQLEVFIKFEANLYNREE